MYLTLQKKLVCGYSWKKRIVGVKNVVEEEEYNHFDEIPSFDTSYKPQLLGPNKTPYLRSDHREKSIYRNQGRKSKPDFCWILFVMLEDVSIGGNGIYFVI
jgi:hypothetical protein